GPGDLSLPLRVEEVLEALGCLPRLDQICVVTGAEIAEPCRRPVVLRIATLRRVSLGLRRPERLIDVGCANRNLQSGAFENIDYHPAGARFGHHLLQLLRWIIAHILRLHEGIFCLEAVENGAKRLVDNNRGVDGDLSLLAGAFDQALLAVRPTIHRWVIARWRGLDFGLA